jgi:hypothetical protein
MLRELSRGGAVHCLAKRTVQRRSGMMPRETTCSEAGRYDAPRNDLFRGGAV